MEKAVRLKNIMEKIPWFLVGLFFVVLFMLPYVLLGEKSYIQSHDQLDGEVLVYLYRAKYLWKGDIIPEFLGGASKLSMTPPAPFGVLLYKIFPPFLAFVIMHVFVAATAYAGMYLLAFELTSQRFLSFVTAGIFAYLPFLPVYGLSIPGLPLLCWALIRLCEWTEDGAGAFSEQKRSGRRGIGKICLYAIVILYGGFSSLILCGFAVLSVIFFAVLSLLVRIYRKNGGQKENERRLIKRLLSAGGLLLAVYLLCNLDLLRNLILGNGFVPHREETVLSPIPFAGNFKEIFTVGGLYARSYNMPILIVTVCILLLHFPVCRAFDGMGDREAKEDYRRRFRQVVKIFAAAFIIAVLAALWNTEAVVAFRSKAGGQIRTFQVNRIFWLLPVCWYSLLALDLKILFADYMSLKRFRLAWLLAFAVFPLLIKVGAESKLYQDLRILFAKDTYYLLNWKDCYSVDIYRQIDEAIGEKKSDYRVVCIGVLPAGALYNGFYCLDGYSNYYPLEYKHEFRQVIAAELEKNDELRDYYDKWGNRVYMFNAESGNYMEMRKGSGPYQKLEYDTQKLYEMGCRYVFAAARIENSSEMGMELLREEPFETEDSYFGIWVYRLGGF